MTTAVACAQATPALQGSTQAARMWQWLSPPEQAFAPRDGLSCCGSRLFLALRAMGCKWRLKSDAVIVVQSSPKTGQPTLRPTANGSRTDVCKRSDQLTFSLVSGCTCAQCPCPGVTGRPNGRQRGSAESSAHVILPCALVFDGRGPCWPCSTFEIPEHVQHPSSCVQP